MGFIRKLLPKLFKGISRKLKAKAIPPDVPTESLFCQQVLANWAKKGKLNENPYQTYINKEGAVHHVNQFIAANHVNPKAFYEPMVGAYAPLTPAQVLKEADIEFRKLPAITEELVTYRGLTKKPEGWAEHAWIENLRNTKEGQVVYFPGYMYTSPDKKWVRSAYSGNEGILMEWHFLPGARVSRCGNEVLTSRSSLGRCLGRQELCDEEGKYTKLVLEYILPNESFRKV